MSEGRHRADPATHSTRLNDRVWHPWGRVNRIIRDVLTTNWDSPEWPVAKRVLRRTLTEREKVARAGWFS